MRVSRPKIIIIVIIITRVVFQLIIWYDKTKNRLATWGLIMWCRYLMMINNSLQIVLCLFVCLLQRAICIGECTGRGGRGGTRPRCFRVCVMMSHWNCYTRFTQLAIPRRNSTLCSIHVVISTLAAPQPGRGGGLRHLIWQPTAAPRRCRIPISMRCVGTLCGMRAFCTFVFIRVMRIHIDSGRQFE